MRLLLGKNISYMRNKCETTCFISFLAAIDENKNMGNALRSFVHVKPDSNTEQDASAEEATTDVSSTPRNIIVHDNTVLYGVPFFMLNPVKT